MRSVPTEPPPINPEPLGKWLADELEARGWSQADFAAILGRPTRFISEIINGKKEITRESAAQIGAALDQTAEMWLNLQDQYLLAEQAKDLRTQAKLNDVRKRALISKHAPVELLRKRDILRSTEFDSLEDEPKFLASARRLSRRNVVAFREPNQPAGRGCPALRCGARAGAGCARRRGLRLRLRQRGPLWWGAGTVGCGPGVCGRGRMSGFCVATREPWMTLAADLSEGDRLRWLAPPRRLCSTSPFRTLNATSTTNSPQTGDRAVTFAVRLRLVRSAGRAVPGQRL
ncbi:transcriptional regulator [Amycolatopsis sp. NPDC059657]|uniref:helix-turn-helix transcriptional regulator n=1 Tax=Amycolatopsis sp. NPDC059657 TaxID=3346899 RepID=UPI003671AA3B